MPMIKNLISFLAILMITKHTTCQVNLFNGLDPDRARAQVESEVLTCFQKIKAGGNTYTVANQEITDIPHPLFDSPMKILFPMTINVLQYISENLFNDIRFAQSLWLNASKSYNFFDAFTNDGTPVPYHNICHGLHVMLYSALLAQSAEASEFKFMTIFHKGDDDELKKFISSYAFAGLFHDAGHNGIGNYYYSKDDVGAAAIHTNIATVVDETYNPTAMTSGHNDHTGITGLITNLGTLAGTNKEGNFRWETIHGAIADAFFIYYVGKDYNKDYRIFSGHLIDHTDMSMDQHFYRGEIIQEIMKIGNIKTGNVMTLVSALEDEMQSIDHFVHAMDISLNASYNTFLIFTEAPLVMQEFVNELEKTRLGTAHDATYDTSPPFTAICDKVYNTLYSVGQTGFNNFVIAPYLERETFLCKNTLDGVLEQAIVLRDGYRDELTEINEDLSGVEYGLKKDQLDQAEQYILIANFFIEKTKLPAYSGVKYLDYLIKGINKNNTLFTMPVDVGAGYLPFTDGEFQHACRITRRRLIV